MLYLINFLLIVFSGFYLTGILSISPIYLTSILSIVMILLKILYTSKINFNKITALCFIMIMYLLSLGWVCKVPFNRSFSYIFNYIYIILIQQTINYLSKEKLEKIVSYFFNFNLGLLFIELLIRVLKVKTFDFLRFGSNKALYYYALKFNSIMYMDTNFVGMFILVILMFAVYLNLKKFNILILKIIFLFTFCKSAIGIYFINNFKKYCVIGTFILFPVVIFILKDPNSLLIRFHILTKYTQYLNKAQILNIIFGIGLGNSKEAIGIGAHNILVTNLLELGFLGSYFNFKLWYFLYKKSKKILIVLIPYFIAGLIFAPTSTPYLYAVFFMIIRFEELNRIKIEKK